MTIFEPGSISFFTFINRTFDNGLLLNNFAITVLMLTFQSVNRWRLIIYFIQRTTTFIFIWVSARFCFIIILTSLKLTVVFPFIYLRYLRLIYLMLVRDRISYILGYRKITIYQSLMLIMNLLLTLLVIFLSNFILNSEEFLQSFVSHIWWQIIWLIRC